MAGRWCENSQAIEKSYLQGDPDATLRAAAWIQHDVAQKLLTLAGLGDVDAAIGRPASRIHAVDLPVRLKGHVESRVRRYDSTNVVAGWPAPRPASNAVLYTAHYDHLGIDPDAKGDNIYNGAADNGTGCGILLEMARAYAQSNAEAAARCLFRVGDGGGAGIAWIAVSGHASARARRADLARFELRHGAAGRRSAIGEPGRRRAHRLLADGAEVAKAFDLQLLPDPNPGRPLLSQRSLLAGAGRHSGLFGGPGRSVRRP